MNNIFLKKTYMQIATITTFPGPLKNIAGALERGYIKK